MPNKEKCNEGTLCNPEPDFDTTERCKDCGKIS